MPKRAPKNKLVKPPPVKDPYDRVLIVCEGAKTEKNYLENLRDHYRLNTANIEVVGTGSDPLNLVRSAITLYNKELEKEKSNRFDRVYCVFDHDAHPRFGDATDLAQSKMAINLARSWPCFEFWILLHFQYTRSPYTSAGGKSPAANCIAELRKELPSYKKSVKGLFVDLLQSLPSALENAKRALADVCRTGEENPSTEFHSLVEYLQRLASEKNAQN